MQYIKLIPLGLALVFMNGCSDESGSGSSKHSQASHSHSHKKQQEQYVCPMHPQITSDKPSTCPICGMDLVPAGDLEDSEDGALTGNGSTTKTGMESKGSTTEKDMGGSHTEKPGVPRDGMAPKETSNSDMPAKALEVQNQTATQPNTHTNVKLSLDKQQMIGVKLDTISKRRLFKTIRAPGRVAFDPELYTAQSEYLEALKQWKRVKNSPIASVKRSTGEMIRSTKIRLKLLGLSESEINRLEKKGAQTEGLLFSGKGQENYVYADVFEVDLPIIRKGQSVEITANFLQGRKLFGLVASVDEVINPATRTAKVRIKLSKETEAVRPESYVNVAIYAPIGEYLTVPIDAIMDTGRETFVFIKRSQKRFEPIVVSVIQETEDYAAISGPVQSGDSVVIGGNFMLDSESRLKSVIRKQIKASRSSSKKTNTNHQH